MARLLIKSGQQCGQVIELNLGVNRLGRSAANDFQLEDPTISANHCDIILGDEGVVVRDKGSTNGTFLDGRRTKEAGLQAGQTLRLGGVELFVETADVTVAIPRIEVRQAAPPVVLADGTMLCPRHASARATYQCTHCREVMCDACVHRMRRTGGTVLNLCPFCSHPCVSTTIEKPKKKRLLRILVETVRLPFLRASGRPDRRV
jgi:hypothetical protein